jgi:hypothetical protein
MELKDFITTSITEIFTGIIEAQNQMSESHEGLINPIGINEYFTEEYVLKNSYSESISKLKFKVAVIAQEKEGAKAGITVFSGIFGGGASSGIEFQDSVTSTIEFEVPVVLPAHRNRKSGNTPSKLKDNSNPPHIKNPFENL